LQVSPQGGAEAANGRFLISDVKHGDLAVGPSVFSSLVHIEMPAAHLRRSLSTALHYDSQSGRHVALPGGLGLRLFDVTSPSFYPRLPPEAVSALGSALPSTSAFVAAVDCTNNSTLATALESTKQAMASETKNIRVRFENALQCKPAALQLLAAKFADAGVLQLVLSCTGDDEDALNEAIESVLWLDVEGELMVNRLGLRSSNQGLLKSAINQHRLSLFECKLGGEVDAPLFSTILRLWGKESPWKHADVVRAEEKFAAL
jgi:hypothetical protein